MPLSRLSVFWTSSSFFFFSFLFLSLIVLPFISFRILFTPTFFTDPSSRSSSCPSTPFTPQQYPAYRFLDSIPTSTASVPRPTYAPRSGRSITRCQGLVPEMKVSAYLGLALACLTNTTFEHEHICIDNLCDGIMIYIPDNPAIIKTHLRKVTMLETKWHGEKEGEEEKKQEEEGEGERARDHKGPQTYKSGGGGGVQQNQEEREEKKKEEEGPGGGAMPKIPSMQTPLWLRCSHHYLPRGLLTDMARENYRQRRNRFICWSLLTMLSILSLTGLLYLHFYAPREPVEFVDEGTDAARLKLYLLRRRVFLPISGGWARWLGWEGPWQLPWLDRLTWVRRKDIRNEVWFKDLETAFKAKRRQQG